MQISFARIANIVSLGFTPFIMTLTECAIQIVFNINLNRATGGNKDYTAALTVMLSALQLISLPLTVLGMECNRLLVTITEREMQSD